jgi:hypothetical protein
MFQMVGLDFTKLKRIIFDYESLNTTRSQGQLFLDFLGLKGISKMIFHPKSWFSHDKMEELKVKYSKTDF